MEREGEFSKFVLRQLCRHDHGFKGIIEYGLFREENVLILS
jgi:hypothetical protein